jgi:hypothetical protein
MSKNDLTPIVLLNVRQQRKVDTDLPAARPSEIKTLRAGDIVTLYDCAGYPLAVTIESRRGKKQFTGVVLATRSTIARGAQIAFHATNIAAVEVHLVHKTMKQLLLPIGEPNQ